MERLAITIIMAFAAHANSVRMTLTDCETNCLTPIAQGQSVEAVCSEPVCTSCTICSGGVRKGTTACEDECTIPISTSGEDPEVVCRKATCRSCSICTGGLPKLPLTADCETECTTPISTRGEDPETVCSKSACTACSICTGGLPVVTADADCETECTTPISHGANPQTVCGKSICTACSICTGGFPMAHGTPIIAADTDCAKECITPISKGADVKAVCSKKSCVDCAICSLDDVKPVFTDCAEMYREQQDKQKCGLHAVNNVIRNSLELPDASRLMKESEMRKLANDLSMPAGPKGMFGYSVVFSALDKRFRGSDVDVNIVGGNSRDGRFVPKTIEEHIAGLAESNASARRLGRGIHMSLADAGWVVVHDASRGGGHYYTYFRLNDYTFCNLDSVIQHNISGHVLPAREIRQCELEAKKFAAIIFPSPKPGIARRSHRSRQATPIFTEIRPLVEMGFSSDDSCKAYIKAGGNLQMALEVLLGS